MPMHDMVESRHPHGNIPVVISVVAPSCLYICNLGPSGAPCKAVHCTSAFNEPYKTYLRTDSLSPSFFSFPLVSPCFYCLFICCICCISKIGTLPLKLVFRLCTLYIGCKKRRGKKRRKKKKRVLAYILPVLEVCPCHGKYSSVIIYIGSSFCKQTLSFYFAPYKIIQWARHAGL